MDDAAPPPDETTFRDAALAYLARYAATEAGLRRVLARRIDRWRRAAPEPDADAVAAARAALDRAVARIVAQGLIDDAAFARDRGAGLMRAGASRRQAAAKLAAKGIDPARARDAVAVDGEAELNAALVLARKRRLGPFGPPDAPRERALGVLARAGFPRGTAIRALDMDLDQAEDRIREFRR
jgi:regulatory protein